MPIPSLFLRAAALAAAFLLSGAFARAAGGLSLGPDERWLVLASRPTLVEAIDTAAGFAQAVGGIRVAGSPNGWFGILVGPVANEPLEQVRARLDARLDVPGDAFLTRGDGYVDMEWQAPPSPVLDAAAYKGKGSVSARSGELVVSLEPGIRPDGTPDTFATGRVGGRSVFFLPLEDDGGASPTAKVRLVRLDAASALPQAVLTTYSMGAHCCTRTRIATRSSEGAWTLIDAPQLDGDHGFAFEDIDGDGAAELIALDETFHYTFAPYAYSYAPPAIRRLGGGALLDVTTQSSMQPYVRRALRRMESAATADAELWGNNGFLAGWVATKALAGEVDSAWSRMLLTHDRTSDWGPQVCTIAVPLDACPEASRRTPPFPEALRAHLGAHGYPLPADTARTASLSGAAPGLTTVADFPTAQAAFDALPLPDRYDAQSLLAALGYWPAVSADRFSRRFYDAVLSYQRERGGPATGIVDQDLLRELRLAASPVLTRWNLQPVGHPYDTARLWVPRGLGLVQSTTATGLRFVTADHSLQIDFDYHRGVPLKPAFDAVVARLKPSFSIQYKVLRDDFFAIAFGTGTSGGYTRYHLARGGIVGFTMTWDSSVEEVHGDRLATVMSDFFRANVSLGLDRAPPRPILVTAPVPASPAPSLPSPPSSSGSSAGSATDDVSSTGTGFFVSPSGHLLTNVHVVDGCARVTVAVDAGMRRTATVVARDTTNDLALLQVPGPAPAPASFRPGVRLGESIAVFGYPLTGLLAAGGNFTLGNVTALAGIRDDSRMLQLSAPVQPGNSGGPLLDESGSVVGVVVSKLNAIKLAAATDDLAQNINFAIKGSVALAFLEAQGVSPVRAPADASAMKPADLADRAKSFTALVECRK